jgi:phosphate transport system permease protein
MNRRRVIDLAFTALVCLCALLTVGAVVSIFGFVAREAAPVFARDAPPLRALVAPASNGAASQRFVWQPVGRTPRYNLAPLAFGSAKVASLALLLATPVGLLAGCALAFVVSSRSRRRLKPVVELLAGVPSVVLGYVALTVIADAVHALTGCRYRLNGAVAAVGVALAITPWVVTLVDEALRSVPRDTLEGAFALGATRAQVTLRVAIPAARGPLLAAVVLAFGRAVGETMIVLMAAGNTPIMDWNLFNGFQTLSAAIATELPEAARGSAHYRVLFLAALVLFALTFVVNTAAELIRQRFRRRSHEL